METKVRYESYKKRITSDLKLMNEPMRWAWFGRLIGWMEHGLLTLDEAKELTNLLELPQDAEEQVFDALAGGLTDID